MGIDIALISSLPHLEDVSMLGDCYMALTQMVLKYPKYAAFHRARAEKGAFVILDNGACERYEASGGIGMGYPEVSRAAALVGAKEVVCQDAPLDGPETVRLTRQFLKTARIQEPERAYSFMAVPQGRTRSEWIACYRELCSLKDVATIGLSKLSIPIAWGGELADARIACIDELLQYGCQQALHLLGGSRALPRELYRLRGVPEVRSNDSSFAFWYAYNEVQVNADVLEAAIELGPPDLENAILTTQQARDMARENAALLRRCVEAG